LRSSCRRSSAGLGMAQDCAVGASRGPRWASTLLDSRPKGGPAMKRCPKCRKNVRQPLHGTCRRCSNCCQRGKGT
jgi:hypothetical protein